MDFIKNKYSEEHIRKVANKLSEDDWYEISLYQKLSENFIREFKDEVDWRWISSNQKLSEDFIQEFQDKVYWEYISRYQTLSENFIRKFQSKVDWYNICYNINLQVSDKFCEEFDYKFHYYNEWRINGKFHRTLGPAYRDGFWYRGEKIEVSDIEQYKHWLKLKIFS